MRRLQPQQPPFKYETCKETRNTIFSDFYANLTFPEPVVQSWSLCGARIPACDTAEEAAALMLQVVITGRPFQSQDEIGKFCFFGTLIKTIISFTFSFLFVWKQAARLLLKTSFLLDVGQKPENSRCSLGRRTPSVKSFFTAPLWIWFHFSRLEHNLIYYRFFFMFYSENQFAALNWSSSI